MAEAVRPLPAEPAETQADDDDALVEAVLAGSPEAFDRLYQRYLKRVYSFVHKRLQNPADTEEVVQEVFTAVFSCLGSFRGDASFSAWVLGIARRTIANRFKKKRHPTVPLGPTDEHPAMAGIATPLDDYEARERIEQLQRAIRRLTEEQRELFELHHLENRSISEIAIHLHKSEDSVKSNLYRARKLLLAR